MTRSTRPVLRVTALLGLGALVVGLLVPASAATTDDAERVGFGIVPATAEDLDDRAYVVYGLAPGSVAYDHVAVVNYDDAPLTLQVYASDATTPSDGGFALAAADSPAQDLGAWLGIEGGGAVEVPARTGDGQPGRVILPVTITVPQDAQPGDHAAGIVASLDTLGQNPQGQNIELQQRVASRVYVQVGGQLAPELAVTDVQARFVRPDRAWRPGSVALSYTVENTGNVRLGYEDSSRVSGPLGVLARGVQGEGADELLPGDRIEVDTTVDGVWPVLLAGVRIQARPVAAPVSEDPGLSTVVAERTVWATTWETTAVLVVVVLLLLLAVLRLLRRHRRRGASPGPRGAGPAPAERRPVATADA